MIIFDEQKYAERIMRFGCYQTLQHQGQERRALARYLKYDLGYNNYEISKIVEEVKSKRKEVFDDDIWDEIMSKLIDCYDNADYIKGYKIGISQTELDIILNQPTEELRDLLFVLTVYFKWARNIREKLCMRGDDIWVKEADLECSKIAGLEKLRKTERIKLFNILYTNGLYDSDYIRRYHNIFTLNFIDDKKPVIIIDSFEEILAYLHNYINPQRCGRCSLCGALIYKSSNKKHMCKYCSANRKHKKGS